MGERYSMTDEAIRWNTFIEDICSRDLSVLTKIQKEAVLCFWYDAEMNSAGHCGYFDCYPDTVPEELVSALTKVADKSFADNYLKALEEIKDEDNGFEDTDDAFYSFEPSLTDHLMAFVENHKDEIFC